MTVPNADTIVQYISSASEKDFTFAFEIEENTDINVYDRPQDTTGVDSQFLTILGVDYNVIFTPGIPGGTVSFLVGRIVDHIITLEYNPIIDRDSDFADLSKLPASDLNTSYDNSIRFNRLNFDRLNTKGIFYNVSDISTVDARNLPVLKKDQIWQASETGTISAVTVSDPPDVALLRSQLESEVGGAEGTRRVGHTGQTLYDKIEAMPLEIAKIIFFVGIVVPVNDTTVPPYQGTGMTWVEINVTEGGAILALAGSSHFTYPLGSVAGNTSTDGRTLTVAQIPAHTHEVEVATGGTGTQFTDGSPLATTRPTSSTGGGESHDHTMTPAAYGVKAWTRTA